MSNSYINLLIPLQLICLTSCSVTFQYPSQPTTSNSSTSSINIMPRTVTNVDNEKHSVEPVTSVLENKDERVVTNTYSITRTTTKVTLCSAFVPPVLPEVPRVDLVKLSSIPANNLEAVNNLLVDNIQAVNQHARKVEELLRIAVMNHRKTCTQKEVIDKK